MGKLKQIREEMIDLIHQQYLVGDITDGEAAEELRSLGLNNRNIMYQLMMLKNIKFGLKDEL